MLAYDYPVLDAFLTILYFALFFIWIYLLIIVFFDIFRSHDMSGWVKGLWVIGIIIFPMLGVLIYLIVRGGSMHERRVKEIEQQKQAFDSYVRQTAGTGDTADQLSRLADLKSQGVITNEEFEAQKAKVLATS